MASRVGNYLLFETLGEGAFGKVKLGVHEETGEQVAVKIMDKSDIKAQEMTMNVRREIAIMKALKHRNIVNLRQVLTSQSKLYIVMDLVTGGELFTKILKEGKLAENTARHYFQQLVDGIEYCHRRGVCHRDLKPENLLIDETTGELKITDFGLSAMKGASTTEELLHTQCGSPNYCAPEIIARHKQGYNGAKVDAWSCGIILFALLAGFLPFYDENTKVLYRMIQRDDVKFPKKFPPEAKDLVLRLLHKEPERRFTLNDVKRHSWFLVDYNGGDTDPKSGGSTASPPLKPKRKGRHGRKPSMDQGPRSRDLPARKKSEKSDRSERSDPDASSSQPLPPVPPPVFDAPMGHGRPPVPPPVAPPNAMMSPLPPVPPVHSPSPVTPTPASRPPAPPVPPPVSPKTRSKASGSVPAYSAPTYGHPTRKPSRDRASRRSRDTFPTIPEEAPPAVNKDQQPPIDPKTGAPAYPFPAPPPFPPAPPVARAAPPRSIEITASPSIETLDNPGNDSQIMPSPATSTRTEENGTPADGQGPGDTKAEANDAHSENTTPAPPAVSPSVESNWAVPNVTRPTRPPVMQPVSTPKTISEGDNTWISGGGTTGINKVLKKNISIDSSEKIQGNLSEMSEEPKSESIVERLRAQYSRRTTETTPPPLPSGPVTAAVPVRKESVGEASASLQQRFGDRGDFKIQSAYPTTDPNAPHAGSASDPDLSGNLPNVDKSKSDMADEVPPLNFSNELQESQRPDEASNGIEILDDSSNDVPLKERLTAAVARYRRIFKLGAKIGITASPSFSSNKGNIGEGSGDDEGKKPSDRTDFFARAKGVTGAWGIILSQELEEDSDSEDDGPQVTEQELEAFSRLLDFWDNRRASATVSHGSEVVLDDEGVSPLSEDDISKIQSLLQKLEPKPEDDVTEVGTGDAQEVKDVESEALSDEDQRLISDGNGMPSSRTIDDEVPLEGDTFNNGYAEGDAPSPPLPIVVPESGTPVVASGSGELSIPAPPPVVDSIGDASNSGASASDNLTQKAADSEGASMMKGVGAGSSVPIVPDVGAPAKIDSGRPPVPKKGVGSAGPPGYEAPKVVPEVPEIEADDILSARGRKTPSVEMDQPSAADSGQTSSNVRFGGYQPAVRSKTQDGSDLGTDKDPIMGGSKRKSSANTSEDHDGRRTSNRVSGRVQSGASDGSGMYNRHNRTASSGEDHAKRGLFTFNMLGRRKSAMTTFDTELMPEECLLEVGKVLLAMGCDVMMKRGENKMKCVARLRNDTLKVSITCTREKKVSHVQFKKGKRDRSQVDAKEFYEFFEVVRERFVQRTGSGERS